MACPKRVDKYGPAKRRRQMTEDLRNRKCMKQFPDCPAEPNDNECKTCPFYKQRTN
jgi:hypothetical protein